MLKRVESALCDHFGSVPARASVSFLGVQPIEVLRFEPIPGEVAYLSLGMSRQPMTGATEFAAEPGAPRAELMLHLHTATVGVQEVWRTLALLAASPAVEGVVVAVGMTIDTGQPLAEGSRCTGVVVVESAVAAVPVGDVEQSAADVAVLAVLPATSAELAWARVRGSEALQELWRMQGCDLLDLGRRGADLAVDPA